MPTEYVSAASWSKTIPISEVNVDNSVTPAGTLPNLGPVTTFMIPTIAAKIGMSLVTTAGTIVVKSTRSSPKRIAANTATWSAAITFTGGEAVIDHPITAIQITASGGAALGELFLFQ